MGRRLRNIPGRKIILQEYVTFKKSVRYYIERGYLLDKDGLMHVRVSDVHMGSNKKILVMCPKCGKKRKMRYNRVVKKGHTYCPSCAVFATQFVDLSGRWFGRWQVIERDKSRSDNNKIYWKCLCSCGNEKSVSSGALCSGNSTSCGCYGREKARERWTGSNHYLWRHDLTDDDRKNSRQVLRSEEEKSWAILVKERDSFTCRACGSSGGILHSHHLYDWTTFPDYRLDVSNGITLCKGCHSAFHSVYGVNDNTPEQFEEWMTKWQKYSFVTRV